MNIAVFASGNLGLKTLQSLFNQGIVPVALLTDLKSTALVEFAEGKQILCFAGNPRKGRGRDFLSSIKTPIDLGLSINYLFIIENDLWTYPLMGSVNFHGSLLPRYRGRTPHVWAIINNEAETGITAHYINDGCDTGDILYQERMKINHEDTGGTILQKFETVLPHIVMKIIKSFQETIPKGVPQNHLEATYFGKRTPDDGKIEWFWQKERIFNWVRAQADPYPGAFAYYGDEKIIIDKIEFSKTGFSYENPNGLIVVGGKTPEVKVSNGVIRIVSCRNFPVFEKGLILT